MKSNPFDKRSQRGSAAPMIIIIVLVIAAAAGAAWWFLGRQEAAAPAPVATTPGATTPGAESAAPTVSPAVEELSIDQLYREARKAMSEQRMVAPGGNNALEYYLAILEKDPENSGASEALRELFPFASGTAEQEIIQGNLDEANRIIESLAKADPSNYTLTILRSKLDSRRRQIEQQEAQAAAAAAAPTPPPTPAPPTEEEVAAAEAAAAAASAAAAPPPPPVAAPPPAPTPAPAPPPQPQGETRDVEVVTPVAPTYPTQAARNREEGWVEVEFTVTADGTVENARVTASDPQRVFDREAVRSIERTKFTPRLENGVPVSSTVRRRIEFKLGG
ncbi:energy transducer TonB [Dokdonella sp.]|uniref:energy transducer TonB n=1 Tax=Dokdonella sp. TaxID=2291710 RepID=UPI003529C95A